MLPKERRSSAAEIIASLDRHVRAEGHGSIEVMQRALGKSRGWWQKRVGTGRLSVEDLIHVLDFLGVDPVSFVREHLGRGDGLELNRPKGPEPQVAALAWKRLQAGIEGPGVGETFLRSLDQQRFEDPQGAFRLAEGAVPLVELKALPRVLGIAGTCLRLLLQVDTAEHLLQTGIAIATLQSQRLEVGLLLQRLAYVRSERGENSDALRLSEQSSVIFLQAGRPELLARSLVDQGIWFSRLGQPEDSVRVLQLALEWLPDEDWRNVCSSCQILALQLNELGLIDEALHFARQAEVFVPRLDQVSSARILWLRARLLLAQGRYSETRELLTGIVETFWPLHPADAALATCDLVRSMLVAGQAREAFTTATSLRQLLEPLRNNKLISAAIADLLRAGKVGLTLALVENVRARIEGERQTVRASTR